MMPEISIIVPVYNSEKYLKIAIESLLNQTIHNIEIILIDDGSIDKSAEICDYYMKTDQRIKVFHQENKGVSAARNKGIELATGKYIGFLDSDDYVEKEAYELMLNKAYAYNADVVACCTSIDYIDKSILTYKKNIEQELSPEEAIKQINYEEDLTPGIGDKIFNRKLFENVTIPVNVPIGEDHSMNCYLVAKANKVIVIPQTLIHYVQRKESISHLGGEFFWDKMYNTYENHLITANIMLEKFPQIKECIIAKLIFQEMSIVISMVRANHYEKELAKKITKDIRKYLTQYLRDINVAAYKKICAILISIHYKCLTIPYKLFVNKIRMKGLK